MASDEEKLLKSKIEQLKDYLRNFGSDNGLEGALLCQTLDEAATQFAFPFPSIDKKVKYANILLAGDESYEYEDDEEEKNETDHIKQVNNDEEKVDVLVLKQLEEAKWIADGIRFQRLVDYEISRMPRMSLAEIHGIVVLVTSLLNEAATETKARMEQLKAQLNQ